MFFDTRRTFSSEFLPNTYVRPSLLLFLFFAVITGQLAPRRISTTFSWFLLRSIPDLF